MLTHPNCQTCSHSPQQTLLEPMGYGAGSRIFTCKMCGAYWLHTDKGWELLIPGGWISKYYQDDE